MSSLLLTDVAKSYGEVEVLRNINLDIQQGELIVFVGPSGCGKSTLLRMIAGLEQITGGDLFIDGERMNDTPPSKRGIAMVFQSYALYPHMTVYDNMAFALKVAKQSSDEIDTRVRRAADMLQLTDYLERLPKALSGGQRQRVAIGRALVRDPKVYLFDEPLSNLDAALRVATRIEIAQLKEQMPERTMIYVTHDQVEAMTLASRIVVLEGGGVRQVGSPLELYERPENTFVAQFIGSPAMNLLDGTLAAAGAASRVTIQAGGEVTVPIATPAGSEAAHVQVGVRPEDFTLAQGDTYVFEGKVAVVESLGEVTLLYFEAQTGAPGVIAKFQGTSAYKRGDVVKLTALPEKMHLFASDGQSYLYK